MKLRFTIIFQDVFPYSPMLSYHFPTVSHHVPMIFHMFPSFSHHFPMFSIVLPRKTAINGSTCLLQRRHHFALRRSPGPDANGDAEKGGKHEQRAAFLWKKMEKNYGKRRKQLWNTNDKIYGEKMETTMEHKRNKTWTKWNKLWTQNGKKRWNKRKTYGETWNQL